MNNLQKISIAVVVATVGYSLPVVAQQSDTIQNQNNNQTTVITGSGNTVTNHSTQTNIGARNGRRTGGSSGVVQSNNQVTDIQGDNNTVSNTNRQTNADVRNGNGRVRLRLPR